MGDWKRDNIWQFIGVIISFIALILSVGSRGFIIVMFLCLSAVFILMYNGRLNNITKSREFKVIEDYVADTAPRFKNAFFQALESVKDFTSFLIIISSFGICFSLSIPEVQMSQDIYIPLLGLLSLFTFLILVITKMPLNFISFVLLSLNIVVFAILFDIFAAKPLSTTDFSLPDNLSEPDITNPKTIIILSTILITSTSWVCSFILTAYIGLSTFKIMRNIEILQEDPTIADILRESNSKLLKNIQSEWKNFQKYLNDRNRSVAESIYHAVPIEIKENVLIIGLRTSNEVENITNGQTSYNTRIQIYIRRYFAKPKLQLRFIKVTDEKYDAIKNMIDSGNPTAS